MLKRVGGKQVRLQAGGQTPQDRRPEEKTCQDLADEGGLAGPPKKGAQAPRRAKRASIWSIKIQI